MDSIGNAKGRYKILKSALEGSKPMPAALLKACESQGSLAKLNLPAEGITPMALNTLKVKADEVIEDGGWAKLNEMRKIYLSAGRGISGKSVSARSAASRSISKLNEVQDALEIERKHRAQLEVAYEALLKRLRVLARKDSDLAHFINKHVTGFPFKHLSVVKG